MEDYNVDETVHKLPCDHLFHENCIVPWLELHDTCPGCLNGRTLNEVEIFLGVDFRLSFSFSMFLFLQPPLKSHSMSQRFE